MADVQFDSEQQYPQSGYDASGPGGLVGMVMKWGLAKNRKQAEVILLVVTVLAAGIAIYLVFSGGGSAPAPVDTPEPTINDTAL